MRFFIGGLFTVALALTLRGQPELIGRILDRVACEADEAQSYALYVPSNYTDHKKWPVIFCFDASARGRLPVERLQAAAEKYGYIVAGSLTSRNGPWTANATAVQAMLRDVGSHFPLDPRRVYTAGVSGGARVATSVALSGRAQGVIACAAGFPVLPDGIPRELRFAFFGTTGTEDFNYGELKRLDGELEERRAVHRIVVFNGGHEWASAVLMMEAVEWFELQAMRAGTRSKDEEWIQGMLRTRLAAVPAPAGLERWRALKSLAADFEGLAETGDFSKAASELGVSREVKAALKTERALEERGENLLNELGAVAIGGNARKNKLAAELRQKADAPEDSEERRMVRRVMASFSSMTRETVRGLEEQGDYEKASAMLEMAVALRPEQPRTWFDLARAQALNGAKKRALEALEQAAEAGYSDAVRTEAEPAFAKLHVDPRFQEALKKIRAHPSEPARPVGR